jgi:hypothetical protein
MFMNQFFAVVAEPYGLLQDLILVETEADRR